MGESTRHKFVDGTRPRGLTFDSNDHRRPTRTARHPVVPGHGVESRPWCGDRAGRRGGGAGGIKNPHPGPLPWGEGGRRALGPASRCYAGTSFACGDEAGL